MRTSQTCPTLSNAGAARRRAQGFAMTLRDRLVLLLLPLAWLPAPSQAACDLPANASAIYGYKVLASGLRCHTLEEAEAQMRGGSGSAPLVEMAFPIAENFDRPGAGALLLDYRPYGALGQQASVLVGPPATLTSRYRAYVKNWPPAAPAAGCVIAGCDSQGCASPELETQRLQCQLDATWDTDPRYCWTRTTAATMSGSVTRLAQVIGANTPSGALLFAPSSSTANNSGAGIAVTAQSCPLRSEEEGRAPTDTQTFSWGLARQDSIACGAGGTVNGAATSAGNACSTELIKLLAEAPQITQTPNQCTAGNPCTPGNGGKRVDVDVFEHGRIRFALHYNSLRQLRNAGSIDGNWSHGFAKRVLTEWSVPGHLSGNPENTALAQVQRIFVQDEAPSLEIYRRDGSLPAGQFRATSSTGRTLRYFPQDGLVPPTYVLTYADGKMETYDRAGRLTRVSFPDNPLANLRITYLGSPITQPWSTETAHLAEAFWRINRITDGSGRYVTFQYIDEPRLRLSHILADDGTELARFEVDTERRLSGLLRFGRRQEFRYNEPAYLGVSAGVRGSWLTGIYDEDQRRYATYTYDIWGRVTGSWHGLDAGKVELTYPTLPDGRQDDSRVSVREGNRTLTYQFHPTAPYRQPQRISDLAGAVQFEYHPQLHRISARIDRRGARTEFQYNADGSHEIARTEAVGTPEQRRTERDWDYSTGRLTAERLYGYANGQPQLQRDLRYRYEAGTARLLGTDQIDPADGRQRSANYVYCSAADAANPPSGCAVTGQLRQIDGPRSDVSDITTYTYYTSEDLSGCGTLAGPCQRKGDLRRISNALGQVIETVSYDRAGRVLRQRDANGTLTDHAYHPRGWLLSRTVRANANGTPSADDAVTQFEYDYSGNVTRSITPESASWLRYSYDDAHRLVAITDALGNRQEFTLDSQGHRVNERRTGSDNQMAWQVSREYDGLNRLIYQLNAWSQPTSFMDYNDAAAGILNGYDANGNARRVNDGRLVDGKYVKTDHQYDALNRLVRTLQNFDGSGDSANARTETSYDARDHVTRVLDPDGVPTTYRHDGLDDLREENSRDAGLRTYAYDLAGNLTSETDARLVTASHVYDALDRRTYTQYPDFTSITREYDLADAQTGCVASFPAGRLSRLSDSSGTTTYCYDRRGNVTRKILHKPGQTPDREIRYSYDRNDRLRSIQYPHGAIVTYIRNANGQVNSLHWQQQAGAPVAVLVLSTQHYPFGPLRTIQFGNAQTLTKRYDDNYAIDSLESSMPGGLALDLETDVLGNITAIGALNGAPPRRDYQYDALNRLTQMRSGGEPMESFTYSPTGDRTSKRLYVESPNPYSYEPGTHRLAATQDGPRSYDANGNTTAGTGNTPYPLHYDSANRLSQFISNTPDGALYTRYTYNGLGQRTRKTNPGESSDTYYDESGTRLADQEWTQTCTGDPYIPANCTRTHKLRTEYIYLDGLPVILARYVGSDPNAQLSYLETDHLGTPRVAIGVASGAVQWRWDPLRTAFGDHPPTILTPGFELNARYPGQYFDKESGLHYNYFRDYEPGTGRYIESDPIGFGGGINIYTYLRSSPLNGSDPYGLFDVTDPGDWPQFPDGLMDCVESQRWDWGNLGSQGQEDATDIGNAVTTANLMNSAGNFIAGPTGSGLGTASHATSWQHSVASSAGQAAQQAQNGHNFGPVQAKWSKWGKLAGRLSILPTLIEGYWDLGSMVYCGCAN
jgi:RHS repeat-associated protein